MIRFVFAFVMLSAVPAMAEFSQMPNPYGGAGGYGQQIQQGYPQAGYGQMPQQGYSMPQMGGQYGMPQGYPMGGGYQPMGYGGGDHGQQQFGGGCGQPQPRPVCGQNGRRSRRHRRGHGQQGCGGQNQGYGNFALSLSFGSGVSMF